MVYLLEMRGQTELPQKMTHFCAYLFPVLLTHLNISTKSLDTCIPS